jgi:hypothetical protein
MSRILGNEFEKEMSEKVKKSEKIEIKRKVSIRIIFFEQCYRICGGCRCGKEGGEA